METMIRTAPPHFRQISMSMLKTHFGRCAPGHCGASFDRGRRLPIHDWRRLPPLPRQATANTATPVPIKRISNNANGSARPQ